MSAARNKPEGMAKVKSGRDLKDWQVVALGLVEPTVSPTQRKAFYEKRSFDPWDGANGFIDGMRFKTNGAQPRGTRPVRSRTIQR